MDTGDRVIVRGRHKAVVLHPAMGAHGPYVRFDDGTQGTVPQDDCVLEDGTPPPAAKAWPPVVEVKRAH